jgi:hypothetical protein
MPQAALLDVPLCIGSIYLASRVRDWLARAAFVALAIAQGVLAYGALLQTTPHRLLVGIPVLMFAVLLTLLGVRHTTRRRAVIIVTGAFLAMLVFSWSSRYYAKF